MGRDGATTPQGRRDHCALISMDMTLLGELLLPGRARPGAAAHWVHAPLGPAPPAQLQGEEHSQPGLGVGVPGMGLLSVLLTSSTGGCSPQATGASLAVSPGGLLPPWLCPLLCPGLAGTVSP